MALDAYLAYRQRVNRTKAIIALLLTPIIGVFSLACTIGTWSESAWYQITIGLVIGVVNLTVALYAFNYLATRKTGPQSSANPFENQDNPPVGPFIIKTTQGDKGPYTAKQIIAFIDQKKLSPGTQILDQGNGYTIAAGDVRTM